MPGTTPTFDVVADYNEYLPMGAATIPVAVTVTPHGLEGLTVQATGQVVGMVLDNSGSMGEATDASQRVSKIEYAKDAVCRLIDRLPDGAWFFVETFSDEAQLVVPLIQANPMSRQQAQQQVRSYIHPLNGTQMSQGMLGALNLLRSRLDLHATIVFLTDGKNNTNDNRPLMNTMALFEQARQQGQSIPVHCFGVGTDWAVPQLRSIAQATLGDPPELVVNPAALAAKFAEKLQSAQAAVLADVRLIVWAPQTGKVNLCKQTVPAIQPLQERQEALNHIFPTGTWGDDPHEFYLELAVSPQPNRVCAGRVSFAYKLNGQEFTTAPQMVLASWTSDPAQSSRIAAGVARATGQQELAQSIQEGVEALNRGDTVTATARLGKAARIAHEHGDDEVTARLRNIVNIDDAATGKVRVKSNVSAESTMDLDALSTRTAKKRTV